VTPSIGPLTTRVIEDQGLAGVLEDQLNGTLADLQFDLIGFDPRLMTLEVVLVSYSGAWPESVQFISPLLSEKYGGGTVITWIGR
jgi:hypothetical protein